LSLRFEVSFVEHSGDSVKLHLRDKQTCLFVCLLCGGGHVVLNYGAYTAWPKKVSHYGTKLSKYRIKACQCDYFYS